MTLNQHKVRVRKFGDTWYVSMPVTYRGMHQPTTSFPSWKNAHTYAFTITERKP